ncbi:NAD(P)-dependent oxidoreductase [Sporosarcina sp. YIM B06819]|uniref:NAD(P)-dependent oxidoreductase n=1 Tax=Sporosarcina sp. YIM B06819 TaxID=3081769 RepID=UPI00298D542F|nr:NAD(P)-dependent oxidoreductase [Sporosarcina sp. YIM B06819]
MKLLLTGAFKYSEEQLDSLKSLGYEILFIQDERFPLEVDVSDIEAIVCNGLFLYNDIKKFENLKFIQLTSAGLDRVPLDYIKDQGIKLFNAKGVYSVPMAEWVVLKILEIYKNSREFYEAQREHKWEKQRDLFELTNKTAAIIGFGDVGAEVAKRLKAFDVNIVGVGRSIKESQYVDEFYLIDQLYDVLKKSDIVILTLPLTKETTHLINVKKIATMKDKSVLINVSRGGVIDEMALKGALQKDKFLGVALDVFENEPLPWESPLWNYKRVIVTPHNSFVSDKVNEKLFRLTMQNLKENIGNIYSKEV